VLGRNEFEVHCVNNWPDLPRSLYGSEKIRLDFVSNNREAISCNETEVCEENDHEKWAPDNLVNAYFGKNGLGASSFDLGVEPVVEVVSWWSVVQESECCKGDEALYVNYTGLDNEYLMEQKREGE